MKKILLVIAMILFMGGNAHSASFNFLNYMTGIRLLEWCEGNSFSCVVYIGGHVDSHHFHVQKQAFGSNLDGKEMHIDEIAKISGFCLPKEITVGQLGLVVTKYLKENPNLLHASASGLIDLALKESFPCSKFVPTSK